MEACSSGRSTEGKQQAIQVVVSAAVSVVLKAAEPRPHRCHQFTVMQVTHAGGKGRCDEDVAGIKCRVQGGQR